MVGFLVGNCDPDTPILVADVIPGHGNASSIGGGIGSLGGGSGGTSIRRIGVRSSAGHDSENDDGCSRGTSRPSSRGGDSIGSSSPSTSHRTGSGSTSGNGGVTVAVGPDVSTGVEMTSAAGSPSPLIPGLPDDMAWRCMARVPFWYHARCKAVCRAWRAAYSSQTLLELREEEGLQEEYLLCFDGNPSVCQGQLFFPQANKWRKIAPTPVELHSYGLDSFGVVGLKGGRVLLVGGVQFDARSYPTDFPVPTRNVYRYDAAANVWSCAAPMIEGRGSMACAAAVDGRTVYVAGGDGKFTRGSRRWCHLSSAEAYDVDGDEWLPLPSASALRTSASGAVVGGRFAVIGGFGAPRLIRGFLQVCETRRESEIYDPATDSWSHSHFSWIPGENPPVGPIAALNDTVYMLAGPTLLRLGTTVRSASGFVSAQWHFESNLEWSDRDAAFFALGGELHAVPSEKVSSTYQQHYAYDPATRKWRARRLRSRLRYVRMQQACKQPFKTAVVVRL